MNILIKSKKGITLIELILVVAIMSIVILLTSSLHLFGLKTFAKSESKSYVQFDARMAVEVITKEVRYATDLTILSTTTGIPATISNNDCYIYLDGSGSSQSILYKDKLGTKTIASFSSASLNFSTISKKTLQYDIDGVYKGESFEIGSDVIPLNMLNKSLIEDISGPAIRFVKAELSNSGTLLLEPSPPDSQTNASYTHAFNVTGGKPPYTYSVTLGNLPQGIILNSVNGVLSGTPTVAGSYLFDIKVIDSSTPQLSAIKSFIITVEDSNLTAAKVAERIYSGEYPFSDPGVGETELILPSVPSGYAVFLNNSSNESIVSLDGVIIAPLTDTIVTLKLKVVNLVNISDTALTGDMNKNIPAATSNKLPVAQNVIITGGSTVGAVLTGNYSYIDDPTDEEGASVKTWFRSDTAAGNGKVQIANGATYNTNTSDLNKFIFFEVTPVDSTGLMGSTKSSDPIFITKNEKPTLVVKIKDQAGNIINKAVKGDKLVGYYQYSDLENDSLDTTSVKYQWKRQKTNKQEVEVIIGATSSEYITNNNDSGYYIYLEVSLRATTGNKDTVFITSAGVEVTNN